MLEIYGRLETGRYFLVPAYLNFSSVYIFCDYVAIVIVGHYILSYGLYFLREETLS